MLKEMLDGIKGIDYRAGKEYLPSDDMYLERLSSFSSSLNKRADYITGCIENEDIEKLVFETHSLKNNAKTVGAVKLSEAALSAETASRSGDKGAALDRCSLLVADMRALGVSLEQFVIKTPEVVGARVDDAEKLRILAAIRSDIKGFDVDGAVERLGLLRQFSLNEGDRVLVNELQNKIDIFEYSDAADIVERLIRHSV